MSFAPDPDTGDLEASIGAWTADPDHSTVTRDTTLAHGGVASLRVTNTTTPTGPPSFIDSRAIAFISPPLAVVATDPAPGGVGSVTVSGWYYVADPTFDVVSLSLGVYDVDSDELGHVEIVHDVFHASPVTHDAWTQMVATIDDLDPAVVASFDLVLIGGKYDAPEIPVGAFMRWDDFDFVGALAVAASAGWVVG